MTRESLPDLSSEKRTPMEIARDIDRLEHRLTSMGTRMQWETLTPVLDRLYAELEAANEEAR